MWGFIPLNFFFSLLIFLLIFTRVAFIGDMQRVVAALGLRPAETGANVILLQPEDEGVLIEAESRQGMRWAPLPVVVADLLSGHGRSPAEADALIAWMAEHQEAWHG